MTGVQNSARGTKLWAAMTYADAGDMSAGAALG